MPHKEEPYASHLEVMGFAFSISLVTTILAFIAGLIQGISVISYSFPLFLWALFSYTLVVFIASLVGGVIFALIYNGSSSKYRWIRFRASTSAK